MKTSIRHILLPIVILATAIVATATPDYQESTSESLMGANSEAYAIRRVESNNQGSYYSSQEKTFIDEYDNSTGKLIKSTLLLDKMYNRDAGHNDPNTHPKVSTEIKHKDKTLRLADIYEKYPPNHRSWKPEWHKNFTYTDYGISFENHLLFSKSVIDKLYKVGFNHDKAEPKLLSIQSYRSCIYFNITTRQSENGISNKIICLSPQKTKQVHAWAYIQPVYLKISSHDSLKEANLEAIKIHQTLREKKKNSSPYMVFEIWSKRLKTNKMAYIVVLKNSTYVIASNRAEQWSALLSTPMIPISSKGFIDRWTPDEKLNNVKSDKE